MSDSLHWLPLYINDHLGSALVATTTPAEEGALLRLYMYEWSDPDCSLPDDDAVLAKLSRLDRQWHKGSGTVIRRAFVPHPEKPGRLINLRLRAEWLKQRDWREKSRVGGLKSGEVRRAKGGSTTLPTNGQADGDQMVGAVAEPKANKSKSKSNSDAKKKNNPSAVSPSKLPDPEWLESLRVSAAYKHLDIDREFSKAALWISANPGRELTRRFFLNWLNGADKPMAQPGALKNGSPKNGSVVLDLLHDIANKEGISP